MAIPSELQALIERLDRELNETEQAAIEGLNIARSKMSRFPDNLILIQLFASLNNAIFFVEISRRSIQSTVEDISPPDVTPLEIQEAGEDLSTLLGRVLEVKIGVDRTITRLSNFP